MATRPKLLLIDDDPEIRSVYSLALVTSGFEVCVADSGREGLKLALQNPPDIIVCDYGLPDTNGEWLLGAFRAEPALHRTQIVMITGHHKRFGARKGMNSGADDYLAKPFSLEDLVNCLNSRLERARQCGNTERIDFERLRADLRSSISHDFFTPLGGILGMTQVLRSEIGLAKKEAIDQVLHDLELSGWRLQRAMRNYLCLLELDDCTRNGDFHSELDAETLAATLAHAAETAIDGRDRGGDMDLAVAETSLFCDREALSILVEELADNACRFSPPGTPIRIRLDEKAVLTITDEGFGMPQNTLESVLRLNPFHLDDQRIAVMGGGLYVVAKIVQRCGASIAYGPSQGGGTKVTVRFHCGGTPESFEN